MTRIRKKLFPFTLPTQHVISVAVVTTQPDYGLCWQLNKRLHIGLSRMTPDAEIRLKNGNSVSFTRFEYQDEGLSYQLVSNRTASGPVFSRLDQVDFVFHVGFPDAEKAARQAEDIVDAIRDIPGVSLAFLLTQELKRRT